MLNEFEITSTIFEQISKKLNFLKYKKLFIFLILKQKGPLNP